MSTVYATYDGEEITAQFSAATERCDYGVKGSPVWDEVLPSTITLDALEILGVEVKIEDLPEALRAAIENLADHCEFE